MTEQRPTYVQRIEQLRAQGWAYDECYDIANMELSRGQIATEQQLVETETGREAARS